MERIERDYCIIGGGIAGLCVARELARAGASVVVADRGAIGRGAGYQAAGMLAPMVEARLQERGLLAFMLESLEYYGPFSASLLNETGIDVSLNTSGSLLVGVDHDELEQWKHRYEEYVRLGLQGEWLTGYECRELEPYLSPAVQGGMLSRSDQQVDNRRLLEALVQIARSDARISVVENAADGGLVSDGNRAIAFATTEIEIVAERYVIATGARMGWLREVLPEIAMAIRPVKGQIMRLDQRRMPLVTHLVRTHKMYMAPKSDGTLVLGATLEEKGFDQTVTAGAVLDLLHAAWECLPAIHELPIMETGADFRPATVDHEPLLGATSLENVDIAAGFFRHGILVAPYAASILAASLVSGSPSRWLDAFSPERLHNHHPVP